MKKLEDYTLKEIKVLCENNNDCRECIASGDISYCLFVGYAPKMWKFSRKK